MDFYGVESDWSGKLWMKVLGLPQPFSGTKVDMDPIDMDPIPPG